MPEQSLRDAASIRLELHGLQLEAAAPGAGS
jgi:hypothetical protein